VAQDFDTSESGVMGIASSGYPPLLNIRYLSTQQTLTHNYLALCRATYRYR